MLKEADIVYLAGPMSGEKMLNYPAFYGAAGIIEKEYGCTVLNPARQPNGLEYEEYMRRAMLDLDRATVIVMLDGWQKSSGAVREFRRAYQRKIDILFQEQVEIAIAAKLKIENPLIIKKDNTQK